MNAIFNNSDFEKLMDIAKKANISTKDVDGIINDLNLIVDIYLNDNDVASSKLMKVLGINTEDEMNALDYTSMIIGYMFMVTVRHLNTDNFNGRESIDDIVNAVKESIED